MEGASGKTAPTGPAASQPPGALTQNVGCSREGASGATLNGSTEPAAAAPAGVSDTEERSNNGGPTPDGARVGKERYFVLKSLTVEDLEQSVRTKVWATQSHNEETLNNAFKVRSPF